MKCDLVYDGTLEGLFCALAMILKRRISASSVTPRRRASSIEHPVYIGTDEVLAGRLFRYIEGCAGGAAAQLICDFFLSGMPDIEPVIYRYICGSIRNGRIYADNLEDPTVRYMHRAVRDLYRQAGDVLQSLEYETVGGKDFAIIDTPQRVLPLIKDAIAQSHTTCDLAVFNRGDGLLLTTANGRAICLDTCESGRDLSTVTEVYAYLLSHRLRYMAEPVKADTFPMLWQVTIDD